MSRKSHALLSVAAKTETSQTLYKYVLSVFGGMSIHLMISTKFITCLFARQSLFLSDIQILCKMSSTVEPTKRNIEIKARIANDFGYEQRVEIAKQITNTNGEILKQRDVFYKVNNGRLKLRMQDDKSMLVQYARPNVSGPKLSEFDVLDVTEPEKLHRMLSASLGVIGEVKKQRYLFLYEQTRIHLDKVDGLGEFLEFEVCLRPEQTVEDGTKIANELMKLFEIKETDLMTGAYMDELLKK